MQDVGKVIRASFWTYLASLLNQVCGFAFWLLVSIYVSARLLGEVAAIVAIAALLSLIPGLA